MCAITGILRRDGGPASREVISRMTDQLGHRGPDGDGIALRGPVAFGHRRLSIIDLEGGRQPMFNEDGNVWVTFNGEIYNYRELADQLIACGHQFRTRSDTETIVHAWEEWGEDCVRRLRGMFAFAVMDWRSGQMFLARDQLGIKPLHYLETPEYFAFSSEPQALRFVPGFNGELSYDAIDQFLWLQYVPAPKSIYSQARKLPPANCLKVNLAGRVPSPTEYWRMNFESDETLSPTDWMEAVDEAIDESVRAHLVSDVPFGAFLSGGVDSSLVVAHMSEALEQPVRAFSIGFAEDGFDETPYAAAAARQCDAELTTEIVRPDALGILPDIVKHYGEPFGDSSAIPTYYVSQLAREHVPMVLSGDGADELFSGYWSHGHFLNFCEANAGRPPQLQDWLQFIHYTDVPTRQALWRPEWRGHCPARLDTFPHEWQRAAKLSPANVAQYLDLKTYLPFDILTKVDIASMAHGLEVRTPFVDVRVAELAARIPDRLNIRRAANGEWERKCLLRQVAAKRFGEAFVNRPKMGFAMPFAKWVAPGGKLHDTVTQRLLGAESTVLPFFDEGVIKQFLQRGAFGPLWLLLFLEEWLRYHAAAPRWTENEASATELHLDRPSAPIKPTTSKPLRPELELEPMKVFDALKKNNAPDWFRQVFEERAHRWDVWQPCFWIAQNMPTNSRVLSVGCGAGYNLFWLGEHGFTDLTGIDVDPLVVAAANDIAQAADIPARFKVDDGIQPRTLPDRRYDVIEALNWTMLIDGFCLADFLDQYLPRLSDEGVLILDAIDECHNLAPDNEFLSSDRALSAPERRSAEFRTRASEKQLRALLELRGYDIAQVFCEEQRVPRKVYVISRAGIAAYHPAEASVTTPPTNSPDMFNQAASLDESGKPKIHLIADVPDWIFARHCEVIANGLGDEFDFDVGLQGHPYDEDAYDLIYPLEWNLVTQDQIKNPAKYVTGIRSHTSWKDHNFDIFTDYLRNQFGIVHVVSERLRDIFRGSIPDIRCLTHGVDTLFFQPSRPVNCTDKKLRIGWAGNRVNPTKGFEQLIQPLGDLPGVELVYCGYLDRKLELPEMKEFYDSIDAYVCSSELEGNNNSLMEAAAMERAIITTDNGTVPEYLVDGQNALIIERTPESFVQAVEQLRDDPQLRAQLGLSARSAVVRNFEWRDLLEKHRALFREALGQPAEDPLIQAEANVRKSLELEPHNMGALRLLHQILLQRGKWAEAARTGEAVLQHEPADVETVLGLAKCFFETNDIEATRHSLEHALELDPNNELARQNLADLDRTEINLRPDIEAALEQGMLALQQDQLTEALCHYRSALDLGLQNQEIEQLVGQLEAKLNPKEIKPGWSFCVITNGKKPEKLRATLDSIRATRFDAKEILVGGEPPADLGDDVAVIPIVDAARNGRLGEMRNRLTERAQFDHLVVCDDDMLFHDDFAAGLERYGDDWEVLCVRLLNPDGTRFWDWATHGGPKGHCLLDYDETDSHTYVTGGLCIMKAEVAQKVQWDEGRGFYQGEDVDFSGRLHQAGISIKFNRHSTVTHDDARYTQSGQTMSRRAEKPTLPVRWLGPVFNPSGYASEAIDFLLPLAGEIEIGLRHQSTLYSEKFVAGLAPEVREKLFHLRDKFASLSGGIAIAHNPANGFVRPDDAEYCIGRTMFETDRISPAWVSACNRMDEVWVPSQFNVETFAKSGVERDKLVVMPGAVDSNHFDPDKHEALPLPNKAAFNFLAIFEWSSRKAWDVLIAAYLREFWEEDDVCLYLRTYQFGQPDGDPAAAIWREIREFAATLDLGEKKWPRIEILTEQISTPDLPRLYRAADCLVGVSRGEGWGRPHHEAMSMALPVIATNWSGNTEFMTEDTACLIDGVLSEAKGLEPELWHYKGHEWANPSATQLRVALRRMQQDPAAARALGQRARAHVVENFSREAVAEKVITRLAEIERNLTTPSLPQPRSSRRDEAQTDTTQFLQVAWEGSYLDFGSLSLVNREFTNQLAKQDGIKLTRVGKNALPANADRGLREMARQLKARARNTTQVAIRHNWPPDWSESAAELRIHCQPWEYGVLPADWVAQVERVDQVWAYTEYVRRVYIDSGVSPEKVKVVPLGIDPKRFTPDAKPIELATKKSFKFLFVGGTIHRKGVDVLLQAYLDAFDIEDDVCLVIKDFGGNSVYQGQTMAEQIKTAQTQPNAPEILYLDCEMSDAEIPGLYTACDCLVHPYRGEGFGLPVLEGMASGLPVIVTGGGATDDFATDEFAWRIPAQRVRLGNDVGGLKLAGNGWLLEPCAAALKHALCEVAANPESARAKGRAAGEHVRSHWTWARSAEIANARIHEAWQDKEDRKKALAKRRSRTATIELPQVARLGELSSAVELSRAKQHLAAWQATVEAMRLRPFHPEAWLTLARIAQNAGDTATARKCVITVQRLAPRYTPARKFAKSLNKAKGATKIDWPALPETGARLSVIMITKNEEQFLDGCLSSVKPVADQLIVVDTGSSDRTIAIAESHGADVHQFKWTGDFSAARNEALSHARGDWVLFIDADEKLTQEGARELQNAMQRQDTLAWRLPIVDVGREHLGRSFVPRLFRNAPGLFFVGRIHEQVSSSVEARRAEWGLEHRIGEATLLHYGYQEDIVRDRHKIARNIRLLEQAIEEFPNDPNLLMNFGLELAKAGQINAALEQYAEAFAVFQLQPRAAQTPELREALITQYATQLLSQNLNSEAATVLESSIARATSLTASQEFLLGLACLNLGRFKDGATRFKACLKKRHEPSLTPASPHIIKGGPDHCLALCLDHLKDPLAVEHFAKALEQDPTSIPLHIDYAKHLSASDPVKGIELLHQSIGETPEHLPVWQTGGDIALAHPGLLEFAADWTSEAARFFPADPLILRQRAEALLLSGQCAEALPIWEQLLSRGGAVAIGAVMVCLVVSGREVTCPAEIEHAVSDAFVSWYRRLLECRNEAAVEKINAAVPRFASVLPFAAQVLQSAIDEAIAA